MFAIIILLACCLATGCLAQIDLAKSGPLILETAAQANHATSAGGGWLWLLLFGLPLGIGCGWFFSRSNRPGPLLEMDREDLAMVRTARDALKMLHHKKSRQFKPHSLEKPEEPRL